MKMEAVSVCSLEMLFIEGAITPVLLQDLIQCDTVGHCDQSKTIASSCLISTFSPLEEEF